jgi:hypothetical protein
MAEKSFHLVPLYYLLRMTDLGREGIANSASYEFADHVYACKAGGSYGVGYLLDAVLLRFPSARAMRYRYTAAVREIVRHVSDAGTETPADVLAVPCGLARELFEAADYLAARPASEVPRVRWYGVDLDGALIARLRRRAADQPHALSFRQGDALDPEAYGDTQYSMILSTGFTEFLEDEQVVRFFTIVRGQLREDGLLFTSAMLPHRISDYLLRKLAEIHTHYRSAAHITSLLDAAGFARCETYQDSTRLQTIVLARP